MDSSFFVVSSACTTPNCISNGRRGYNTANSATWQAAPGTFNGNYRGEAVSANLGQDLLANVRPNGIYELHDF